MLSNLWVHAQWLIMSIIGNNNEMMDILKIQ